ncbi:MAG: hypothetical protein ABSA04_10305 [Desulfobaccales bacterium]
MSPWTAKGPISPREKSKGPHRPLDPTPEARQHRADEVPRV